MPFVENLNIINNNNNISSTKPCTNNEKHDKKTNTANNVIIDHLLDSATLSIHKQDPSGRSYGVFHPNENLFLAAEDENNNNNISKKFLSRFSNDDLHHHDHILFHGVEKTKNCKANEVAKRIEAEGLAPANNLFKLF